MAKHARMRRLIAADFAPGTPPATLADDEIHVWLSAGRQGAAAGAFVDGLLAAYLGTEPSQIAVDRDSHGKPYLVRPLGSLQFNLSHSGRHLIVAISRSPSLGVDIETASRTRPWLALAQRYFTPAEHATLTALPEGDLAAAFLALWSCKEAVVKALGRGIAFGLHRLGFGWAADGSLDRLVEIDIEAGRPDEWNVVQVFPARGVTGALAWRGPDRRLRAFMAPEAVTGL